MSNSNFAPPSTIQETVAEITGLKAGVRAAIRGVHVMAPAIANQVDGLYELAGEPETGEVMASAIRAGGGRIAEALEVIAAELAKVGVHVARGVRAHEENEAKRKVAAAKTGTTSRARGAGSTIQV